jgi:hypothetical protein
MKYIARASASSGRLVSALVLLTALLLSSTLMMGQAVSGDLVGKVMDASGAVVSAASVEAINMGTGQRITTSTNANGEYRFSNLPVGHYKLQASGNGMVGGYQDVRVELNKTATANITAAVSSASTVVEVIDQAATIDTTTAQIQTTYETKQAQDLPAASVGLGVLNLSLLQAGVASSGGIGAGTGPSVSGQRPRNNNFTIEGVDNNDKGNTGPVVYVPNDAVANFSVLQNNFSPEFGHSSGGQFNTTILSGTNSYHGRAYEYFQNRKLNAQDSQTVLSGITTNPRYDNNRFGGQFGGPILKDKLFFFTNWEYNPIGAVGGASSACAPTAAGYATLAAIPGVRAENLAGLKNFLQPAASAGGVGCDPSITVAGTNIPIGTVGFNGSNFNNTLTTTNSVDFNPTTSDQVRFRYVYSKNSQSDIFAQLPTFWNIVPLKVHLGTLSEYHTFSPTVTNEFRAGYNRYATEFVVGPQEFPGLAMFPNVTLDDLGFVNIGPNPNSPQGATQNLYQFTDNLSWLKGKHSMKFGVEARKYIAPQTFTQRVRGDYEWTNTEDYLFDLAPTKFGERSTGNPIYNGDQKAFYAYANDQWRVTSNLTLNLGLRYEYTGVPAAWGYQALNSIADVPGLVQFRKPNAQTLNFAPRVGFAYSPGTSGNTSIRGGFAMAYDVIYDNLGLLSLPPELAATCDGDPNNPPTGACPYSTSAFLANGGLPAGGGGVTTFASQAEAAQATSSYIPDQKLPYSESWNLGVQHVFAKKYITEVRYVGTKGIHLPTQIRINRQNKITDTSFLPTYLSAPNQAALDALPLTLTQIQARSNFRPEWEAGNFNGASVVPFEPWGQSIYHGLQTQVTRNFTNGLQFQAAWTWSHLFDNSTADVFSTLLTPRRPQDFNCLKCDMSTSALDRRHRITLQVIYDVPFFKKNSNWFAKNLLGNWEVAPVYTFQSPQYATVQSGVDSNLNGDAAGDRAIFNTQGTPGTSSSVTALTNTAGETVAYVADDPNAYYIQAGPGAHTNTPRNTLPLPRINNWDLTAVKRFSIREGMNLEFQAQALNVFNHAQFVPGSLNQVNSLGYTDGGTAGFVNVGTPSFNQASQAFSNQPRAMQLALKFTF